VCGSIITAIVGGLASAIGSSIFKQEQPAVQAPAPVQAPAAAQAAQQPDEVARRASAAAVAATDSPANTLLTGPGGVSLAETKSKLGKNNALGE